MERLGTIAAQAGLPTPVPADRRAVIVAGVRTPFTRAFGEALNMDTIDLAGAAVRGLLDRTKVPVDSIDHIVWGGVILRNGSPNTARELAIDLKLPPKIAAHTETMACASGLKTVLSACMMIESGNGDVIIAGGSDSTSNTELPLAPVVSQGLALYSFGKIGAAQFVRTAGLPCSWMPPRPAIAERSTGKTMGYHADVIAQLCGVSRKAQDDFAMASHAKAAAAIAKGLFADEVVPLTVKAGAYMPAGKVAKDSFVRGKQDPAKVGALKPAFRTAEQGGTITAATASPLTDGAAAVLVMSAAKAKALGYPADVAIRSWAAAGTAPDPYLLLAPAAAIPVALRRAGLALKDIDFFEIHEAFAGQVLATVNVLASKELSAKVLGLPDAVGTIPLDKINVFGSSIALGHPFGATGSRCVTNAARILRTNPSAKYVLISICAAGGLGLVAIVERI